MVPTLYWLSHAAAWCGLTSWSVSPVSQPQISSWQERLSYGFTLENESGANISCCLCILRNSIHPSGWFVPSAGLSSLPWKVKCGRPQYHHYCATAWTVVAAEGWTVTGYIWLVPHTVCAGLIAWCAWVRQDTSAVHLLKRLRARKIKGLQQTIALQ